MSYRHDCDCDPMEYRKLGTEYSYKRQVVLELPQWSRERARRLQKRMPTTVCVDKCIAHCIQELWEKGIETTVSCCGHNYTQGWVSVDPGDYKVMFEAGYDQRQVQVVNGWAMGLYTFNL